jgi:hypothetical protein
MLNSCAVARLVLARIRARHFDAAAAVLALLGLFFTAGCGSAPDHGERVALSGTVTVKGQPLDVPATIFFNPPNGQDGIGSAAEISDGRFTIPEDMGPTPGKQYDVKVVTVPGIPAPGTPPAEIKRSQEFKKTVEVPARGDAAAELKIDFE